MFSKIKRPKDAIQRDLDEARNARLNYLRGEYLHTVWNNAVERLQKELEEE